MDSLVSLPALALQMRLWQRMRTDDVGSIWLNDSISDGKMNRIETKLEWYTFGKKASFGRCATACHCAFMPPKPPNLEDIAQPILEQRFLISTLK